MGEIDCRYIKEKRVRNGQEGLNGVGDGMTG